MGLERDSRIQKAHVGVGIAGAEGREAVNASDFAIAQFRFLRSLLFVHGRSNIRRIGIVIGYSFYKNFLLVLCMACYAPWNGLSGTTFFDSYLIMMRLGFRSRNGSWGRTLRPFVTGMSAKCSSRNAPRYNMVFTSVPIFIVGSLDVDVYAPAAFAIPKLYFFGVNKALWKHRFKCSALDRHHISLWQERYLMLFVFPPFSTQWLFRSTSTIACCWPGCCGAWCTPS